MDNWMAPRAFTGGNGKLSRPGGKGPTTAAAAAAAAAATATQQAGHGESGEESGGSGMGMLKRKRSSPPESPTPNKKPTPEESGPPWSSSTPGEVSEVIAGKSQAFAGDSRVTKQQVGQPHESVMGLLAAEEAVVSSVEKDADGDLKSRVVTTVENISHGQGASLRAPRPAESPGSAMVVTSTTSPSTRHLIPTHAGWFNWNQIHQLERLGLPEFFSGKNKLKTPEIYKEHRNLIISKYREDPSKLLKVEDVQGLLTGDVTGVVRVFEFLDHWGLINYQVISDFSRFISPSSGSVEESPGGALQLVPSTKPALSNLFQFDTPRAAHTKLLTPPLIPPTNVPLATLVENVLQESLSAPDVEYHCNSCQADCSKRRYHCQKQADFDLCPDCYNDGKFGEGMTSTDFLRMDALTDTGDADGGGWSDQETLLLLEALELYGDNWSEIAEHVATKSKAQCILHFIRLPIEDPFLENMEVLTGGIVAPQPPPVDSDSKASASSPKDGKADGSMNQNSSTDQEMENLPKKSEKDYPTDATKPREQADKDSGGGTTTEDKSQVPLEKEKEKDGSVAKDSEGCKAVEATVASVVLAAAEAAGFGGPDGLVAFADAGNPVMAQVAFLAAMVGPRVAATAAQAALKALAEEDPVGYLSSKNSFGLDPQDVKRDSGVPLKADERLTETSSAQIQTVSAPGLSKESYDSKVSVSMTSDDTKKDDATKSAVRSGDGTAGEGVVQESVKAEEENTTSTVVKEEDAPPVLKVKSAAAVSLASAAVKAKLLADQEEREIQRLVASVIENQLKKLELKLKQFSELETMLGKECEQVEKARSKVIAERSRIMQSRGLSSTAPPNQPQSTSTASVAYSKASSQMQTTTSTSAAYTKVSSNTRNPVTQPKTPASTFGPTVNSTLVTAPKAVGGSTSGSSVAAATHTLHQSLTSRGLLRTVPGANVAPEVSKQGS